MSRALAVVPTLLLGTSVAAPAQTLLYEFAGESPRDQFGATLVAADLDGDGRDELIIGAPWDDTAGANAGRVVVVSGTDGSPLDEWFGEDEGDVFGSMLAVVGDIDGDGAPDVLVGAAGVDLPGGYPAEGRAYIISGRTGDVLRTHDGASDREEFGSRGGAVGDVNADGVEDYAIGELWWWFDPISPPAQGSARLFSGATGEALALTPVLGGEDFFPAGDVDDDGRPDWLVERYELEWSNRQAQLRTALAESVVDSVDDPAGSGAVHAGPANDVTGDSLPEYAFAFTNGDGDQIIELRGTTGTHATLALDADELALHGPIGDLDGRADLDGDGTPDLLVGLPASSVGGIGAGEIRVLSGVDLSELVRLTGTDERAELGRCVIALGDLDNDGIDDFAVSAPARNDFSPGAPGRVFVFAGGALGWADVGDPLAGTIGESTLSGAGTLQPGAAVTLALVDALPDTPTSLVIGTSTLAIPFKSGSLVPSPDLVVAGVFTDGSGGWELSAPWPSLAPGTSVVFQVWFPDAGAAQGWAASNGLTARTSY